MFVQLIFLSFSLPYCFTMRNKPSGICQKINLCRQKIEPCYPVVTKCRNGSCRFRRFNSNDNQRMALSRWFYDSNFHSCYRNTNEIEDFVYFRFRRDCSRLCSRVRQKRTDQNSLPMTDHMSNNNDTAYVNLNIDLSSSWIEMLADWMNISMHMYNAQVHYFQNYRRRFTNFIDRSHQLMLDRQQKNNY